MSAVEKFPVLLSEAEEESSAVPPCFSHEGINVRNYLDKPSIKASCHNSHSREEASNKCALSIYTSATTTSTSWR